MDAGLIVSVNISNQSSNLSKLASTGKSEIIVNTNNKFYMTSSEV